LSETLKFAKDLPLVSLLAGMFINFTHSRRVSFSSKASITCFAVLGSNRHLGYRCSSWENYTSAVCDGDSVVDRQKRRLMRQNFLSGKRTTF
jgi:hypothetical protein